MRLQSTARPAGRRVGHHTEAIHSVPAATIAVLDAVMHYNSALHQR